MNTSLLQLINTQIDIEKIQFLLRAHSFVSLESGIRKTIEWQENFLYKA